MFFMFFVDLGIIKNFVVNCFVWDDVDVCFVNECVFVVVFVSNFDWIIVEESFVLEFLGVFEVF